MIGHCTYDMSSNKKSISDLRSKLRLAQDQGLLEFIIDIRSIKTGKYGIMYEDPFLSVKFLRETKDHIKMELMKHIHQSYEHIKCVKLGKNGDTIDIFYDESEID